MRLRDKIKQRMAELAEDPNSPWERLPSRFGEATIRRTWTRETPDYHQRDWPEPTYHAHAFLTLVAGKIIMGTSAAPWVRRLDQEIPLWLAEAVLEDPELALDTERRMAMRDARRAGK
jgi:hypothetical protein